MKKENRLLTIDGETLMSQPLTPLNFVVDTLLSQGLHILAGSPKVGKSWLALWLAVTVAKGDPVWGMGVKQGTTLYLCLEDSTLRIQNRLFEITEDAPANVHFTTNSNTLGKGLEEQLRAFLTEHPDTVLVIIDTLQMIRGAGYDNTYANDYRDLSVLKHIADTHGISILLVHHLRKMNDDDPMNMISGTTGLSGATDSNFVLRKSKRRENTATLYCTGRDIAYRELALEFDTSVHVWDLLADDHEDEPEPQDEIIPAVSAFLAERGPFSGRATELAEMLKPYSTRDWTPAVLSKKLIRFSAELNALGIRLEVERTREKRNILLCLVGDGSDGSDGKNETGPVANLLSQPSRRHGEDETPPCLPV